MNTSKDPLDVMHDLKPALMDQLAEDGYARHRHEDLARAAAEGYARGRVSVGHRGRSSARPGQRWRVLLTGGLAATAAAAVAAVMIMNGTPSPTTGGPHASSGVTLDARTFLLASANTASQASAATGAYWYTKERDFEPTATVKKQRFGAAYAETEESWAGADQVRTIVNEGVTFSFASSANAAKWKAAGSPPLATASGISTQPRASTYKIATHWGVGDVQLTIPGIRNLPTTAARLGALLRKDWNNQPDKATAVGLENPTYGQYLVQWADVLLSGPAQPGTRSAIYELLAEQPGVELIKGVTDPLSRVGTAVTDGAGDYLVINPSTAQLLAFTTYPLKPFTKIPANAGGTEAIVSMGWTNQLG